MDMTGLSGELAMQGATPASREDLLRVHPASYLDAFKEMSDTGGGEIGERCPFGPGGYDIAATSAGLAKAALEAVLKGELQNAYSLSRPPGHHCLPEQPMGFCLLANISIAIESALAKGLAKRVAVIDWDVHHGNGTEAIYYDRGDVLTISIHQENNFPPVTSGFEDRGKGAGEGCNLNVPLPPGAGHASYLEVMETIVIPQMRAYQPDVIIVACGFDATSVDPLARMMATADTFRQLTRQVMTLADEICEGRVMMAHEGGYSEVYVPFCGHAVLQEMSGSRIEAADPMAPLNLVRQPGAPHQAFVSGEIAKMRDALGLSG
jgi:acetoin utilization deacetylase AcuC-like enzyme